MIENAAVFVSGRRVYKGVNVEETEESIVVKHRVSGETVQEFPIVEVGKAGMAWDVEGEDGQPMRLVAQQGCGCGGMKPYKNDPEYTGPFVRR